MVVERGAPLSFAARNEGLSSRLLRIQNTTTASTAPIAKGMRHPQACRASLSMTFCRTISTARARSWPMISVTYWKLDQKPRRARPAISDI
jgi:hypothetical protein